MRDYELVFIIHPDQDENGINGLIDRVKGWITDAGGSVETVDVWGRRRLAYIIRKQREGVYVFVKAQMPPTYTTELERNLRFAEPVMRYLLTTPE
jgi:small subunit ribosomal protein S6